MDMATSAWILQRVSITAIQINGLQIGVSKGRATVSIKYDVQTKA
jgi:hypothetical protein